MRNRLFYTIKLTSALLKEYQYDLTLNFEDALAAGLVISLSDSQMLKSVRDITGQQIDRVQLEEWFSERDRLKKSKNNTKEKRKRIKELQSNIYNMMYIPQYITVVMESVGEYEKIFRKGFKFNGKLYKRMSCSASQARVSTIVFVDDDIRAELRKRLDCGRDLKHPLAPSKYNAYFGLYSSAIKTVTTPRFCVVPDYTETQTVDVDYVIETDKDSDDIIEPRTLEIEFNRFDGSGIISPQFAEVWGKDLGEDYTPCQFCLRSAFTKGMVNVFDFVEFCAEKNNGNYIITDVYGKQKDLREIDVILSESQVKLWDSWDSQEDFERNCKENGIVWGITKYAPKRDKDVLVANYQYLQTLNLNDDMIADVCHDTVKYIQGVSYQNKNYALLFLLGSGMQVPDIESFLKNSDNYWLKSLVLNNDLFNDKYTREKIRDLIVRKIELACLGKLIVQGNYQCIVPDNYAYMEHITGQPVKGLLNAGEFYSQYWNNNIEADGERTKKVDCMRSPLTHFSEHYVVDLKQNEDTEKWFKYSYSGIITNVHDEHTMKFAGSDYDYDILSTTNNRNFINGVYPNQRVVTYDVRKPHKKLFDEEDLFVTDTFSFGNAIGQITNTTSTFVSMMAMFSPDSAEYKQLSDRIKAGCAAQSRQIDKTKIGEAVKTLGTICKQFQRTNPEDDMETRIKKDFYNRILADKKPYFFKYKYKALNKELNEYDKKHDELAQLHYSKSLKEIKAQDPHTLTPEEQTFLYYYEKFLPVVDSDCVMNKICKYIENIDFHIKQKVRSNSEFNYKSLQSESFTINKKLYEKIKAEMESTLKQWEELSKNKTSKVEKSLTGKTQSKFDKDVEWSSLKSRLEEITSNEEALANHLIYFFYEEHPSLSKATLWGLVGRQIYENIKSKVREYDFPVKDEYGNIEFLYEKYQVQHLYVSDDEEEAEDIINLKPDNVDGELDDRYI